MTQVKLLQSSFGITPFFKVDHTPLNHPYTSFSSKTNCLPKKVSITKLHFYHTKHFLFDWSNDKLRKSPYLKFLFSASFQWPRLLIICCYLAWDIIRKTKVPQWSSFSCSISYPCNNVTLKIDKSHRLRLVRGLTKIFGNIAAHNSKFHVFHSKYAQDQSKVPM